MKKLMMLGAVALFLTSCSSSDDDNTTATTTDAAILPVKIEFTESIDGVLKGSSTNSISFNGNKVSESLINQLNNINQFTSI